MKKCVCYFSASGVTKKVAEKIANAVEGDLFEIEPVQPYTDADLNWRDKMSRSSVEMGELSSRPEIRKKLENFEEYDTFYLGFPVWWDVAPRIINTFLEAYDFTGKKIYVFVTSGGSSYANSLDDLRSTYPKLNFVSGNLFSVNDDDRIDYWIHD